MTNIPIISFGAWCDKCVDYTEHEPKSFHGATTNGTVKTECTCTFCGNTHTVTLEFGACGGGNIKT